MNPSVSQAIKAASHATQPLNQNLKPEWIRVPEAVRFFGLCRSSIYALIAEGAIRSFCLRNRNAVRGIRLVNFDSLAAYINRAAGESLPQPGQNTPHTPDFQSAAAYTKSASDCD
jgi:hypothetical protein